MDSKTDKKESKVKEVKDEEFYHQKSDLKIILIGDTAVGKSK